MSKKLLYQSGDGTSWIWQKSQGGHTACRESCKNKGNLEQKVSDSWYTRFMTRHPSLSLRKGDPIANVRMECTDKDTMAEYFDLLKTTLL